jgi:iron complex transport system substrate-binding protein
MDRIDEISAVVISEAIGIHRELGPGLFESVYATILAGRLERAGLHVARQFPVPITFDGKFFESAFKVDLLVEERLVLEIKAIDALTNANTRQLLTYLRLLRQPVGLLLNFSGATMKEGIKRLVNNHRSDT